jgi:hypothetical protein
VRQETSCWLRMKNEMGGHVTGGGGGWNWKEQWMQGEDNVKMDLKETE